MSLALTTASRLKPEIRLAQAVSEFEADLSTEQKHTFRARRISLLSSPPSAQDVMRLTAEIDRAGKGGRCLGPRLTNVLEATQKFASLGDIIIGGSQNLVACGVWTIVRMSLLLMTSVSSYLEKIAELFMIAGRFAPRFETLALLYPKSRDLQSSLSEYFIVVVCMCHDLLNFTRKSNIQKIGASLSDASLVKYQKDLESWGLAIRDEVNALLMVKVHEEARANMRARGLSAKLFKTASHRESFRIQQMILDFCSKYDPITVWKQVRKAGNTNSFRQSLEYQTWRRVLGSSTLIYTGKLGSGKSVLLANLVDDLHIANDQSSEKLESKEIISFFFCRYDMPETLTASAIIGSLSRQILGQVPYIANLLEVYRTSGGLAKIERLVHLVCSATYPTNRIFLVIDGIDELQNAERLALSEALRAFQENRQVFICLSYRQDGDGVMNFDSEQLFRVQIASMPNNTTEIEGYVENELQRRVRAHKLIVGDLSILLDVKRALVDGSDGMFLWTVLQIEALCAMQTDEEIRNALKCLPSGLSETFSRILQSSARSANISKYQIPILELVTVAQRPLLLEELREALSVTPGNTTWNPSGTLNNIHATLASCGGLVVIDEEFLTLSFVHHSVRQYLLGDFEDSACSPTIELDGHRRMCAIIVTYLNYSCFDRQVSTYTLPEMGSAMTLGGIFRSTNDLMGGISSLALKMIRSGDSQPDFNMAKAFAEAQRQRPRLENQFFFRGYALSYWEPHVICSSPLEVDPFRLLQRLLNKKIIAALPSLALFPSGDVMDWSIASIVEHILESEDMNVNKAVYPQGRTVLHMAVLRGLTELVMKLIVSRGPSLDINLADDSGQTAIDIAREGGYFSLMQTLGIFAAERKTPKPYEQAKNILFESIFDLCTELEATELRTSENHESDSDFGFKSAEDRDRHRPEAFRHLAHTDHSAEFKASWMPTNWETGRIEAELTAIEAEMILFEL